MGTPPFRYHPLAQTVQYEPLLTLDTDVALPVRLEVREQDLRDRLASAGFNERFLGEHQPPATHYRLGDEEGSFSPVLDSTPHYAQNPYERNRLVSTVTLRERRRIMRRSRTMKYRIALWGSAGFLVAGFWALFAFATFPATNERLRISGLS